MRNNLQVGDVCSLQETGFKVITFRAVSQGTELRIIKYFYEQEHILKHCRKAARSRAIHLMRSSKVFMFCTLLNSKVYNQPLKTLKSTNPNPCCSENAQCSGDVQGTRSVGSWNYMKRLLDLVWIVLRYI